MPTVAFHEISDSDLGALIGYLKTITPVSKESPAQELAFGAQAGVALREVGDEFETTLYFPREKMQ